MIAIIFVLLLIGGIGSYLAPDSLRSCESTPGANGVCGPADAIVAVSGGDTEARTRQAIDLYQKGWADTLIFSGAAADKSGPSNAQAMQDYAIEAGVPADAILTEEFSETTRQNAENTQTLLQEQNIGSVILVTSAYHQRRAALEFESRVAGEVYLRTHPVRTDNQWGQYWWLTGSGWYLATSELVKIGVFYFGGIR